MAKLQNRLLRFRIRKNRIDSLAYKNLTALENLNLSLPVRSFRYVVFDLETTGLDVYSDQIVSIGAYRVVNGRIRLDDVFSRLINPGGHIPPMSVKIHGIVPDMVANASTALDILKDFLNFINGDILVAHQARFDTHFLNRLMKQRYGFNLQNIVFDTILMYQKIVFPLHPYPYGIDLSAKQCSLDAIAKHYGIVIQQRHTALGDALATAMIFQRVIVKLEKEGNDKLRSLFNVAAIY